MRLNYRLLLIGSSYNVGLTFYYVRLAIALKRIGIYVEVVSSGKAKYPILPHELSSQGIEHCLCPYLYKLDPISIAKAVNFMKSKVREGFDMILGGGVREGLRIWLATRFVKRKPISFSIVGSLPREAINKYFAMLSYGFFYDRNIALCNYTKVRMTKMGIGSTKIHVIPMFAPDLEWFDKAKKSKVNLKIYNLDCIEHPVVFYAARHDPYKGFTYYLKAASEVLKKTDAIFILGGSGPYTGTIKRMVEKLKLTEHVIFTGWISNYHMPYILNEIADICVSTSLVEQLPSYIMECMAAGKPVIASDVGGVSEIVMNEVNGYIIPPRDYKKTAYRIIELLDYPQKAREMGNAGRKIIERELNMKVSIRKLLEVYEKLINKVY